MANGFKCTKCGECCRNLGNAVVVIFPSDYTPMARGFGVSEHEFREKFTDVLYPATSERLEIRVLKKADDACIFVTPDNLCSVYGFQPIQCQLGPDRYMARSMMHYPCMQAMDEGLIVDTTESDDKLYQQFYLNNDREI
ncbi:YkgJ family cysteine cluster protein [Kordiimonas sp.]|uniref:YkgJ family cysteine cluster protein n=1 Tax=Kordiimonas sp. TaxID=1970157 RepID=UPI003A8CEE55